jgi:hypothetical protein
MGPGTAWKGTPGGTPLINVSGPVPKENLALVIVVADVTPERLRVKVAGPITKGSNCPPVKEPPPVKLELEGRIS